MENEGVIASPKTKAKKKQAECVNVHFLHTHTRTHAQANACYPPMTMISFVVSSRILERIDSKYKLLS